jgi:2-dehydro-3-deoxyphosphogluconate aldolase/(4S)-4-hydroxy-2-oxoglutarate aldolase
MNQGGNQEFTTLFAQQPLMAILRGFGVERSLALAKHAWSLGIKVVEVPVQSAEDLEALRVVARAGAERGLSVGAGTVLDPDAVEVVAAAGARFTVSPGLDERVVAASVERGVPPLPGVATASEVQRALAIGLTWLKAFPASVLGPGWFAAMAGPFPAARFVATGGMTASTARTYLKAGARVIAVGAALTDPEQLPMLATVLDDSKRTAAGQEGV